MTPWRALVGKEIRAIAWPAAGAIAVMAAARIVLGSRLLDAVAFVAYVAAPIAIGAIVVGHEFTHQTFASQLTQPIPRRHLLAAKVLVLAAALAALGLAAHWAAEVRAGHAGYGARVSAEANGLNLLLVPLACGFFLAPAFTLLSKSTLAGVVFSAAVPAGFWIVGQIAGISEFGNLQTSHPLMRAIQVDWLRWGLLAMCAASALGLWIGFPRLQATGVGEMRMPSTVGRAPATLDRPIWVKPRRRPLWWRLVTKEIRLQQMTFVLAGLYMLASIPLARFQEHLPGLLADSAGGVTYLYALFVAILAGSLASAEERQLGTLEWQTLLPAAAWNQWTIKLGTTLLIAVGLGIGVPFVMSTLLDAHDLVLSRGREFPEFAAASVLLTCGSLYVSSLSSSGIRAFVLSFPAFAGVAFFGVLASTSAGFVASGLVDRRTVQMLLPEIGRQEMGAIRGWVSMTALLAVAAFVVWIGVLAMQNHRSAERGGAVARRQLVRVGLVAAAGLLLSALVNAALSAMRYGYLLRS
jgi:ABC-type transport system involved in multi-copper enzyme maturation permease subunit